VHPNEALIRDAYMAMTAGDGKTLAALLTPTTQWIIAGHGPLAGTYTGPDEIFSLWKSIAAQTRGGLHLEVEDVLANDDRAVVLVVATGNRGARRLHERQVAVFEFNGGKVQTARFIYEDPDAYDRFWTD
jgi:ketosteroid isomerase-like protein